MRLPIRILIALFAVVAFRYPFWAFQFDGGDLRSIKPWADDFRLMCVADCWIYADLSEAYPPNSSAFFPGFPLLIRAAHFLLPELGKRAVGILVSNLFALVAGVLILFLGDALAERRSTLVRRRLGFAPLSWLTLAGVSLFPNGHFWMQGFSEPVFAVLLAVSLLFVARGWWLAAAVPIGLAGALRPQGVWLGAAFGIFWIYREWKARSQGLIKTVLAGALVIAPFLVFCLWLYRETGNPFHFLTIQQSGWGRKFSLVQGLLSHLPQKDLLTSAYLYISLAAAWVFIRRPDPAWKLLGIFTLVLTDAPLFVGGFLSYVRFMSVNLGMFFLIAEKCESRPWLAAGLSVWAVTRLAIQVYHSSVGWWVG